MSGEIPRERAKKNTTRHKNHTADTPTELWKGQVVVQLFIGTQKQISGPPL